MYPTELTLFSGSLYYTQATKRISPADTITQYITFTATSANSSVKLTQVGTETGTWKFKYSTNNTTWSDYTTGTSITLSAVGNYVSFAGIDNYNTYQNASNYKKFTTTGGVRVSGLYFTSEVTKVSQPAAIASSIPSAQAPPPTATRCTGLPPST